MLINEENRSMCLVGLAVVVPELPEGPKCLVVLAVSIHAKLRVPLVGSGARVSFNTLLLFDLFLAIVSVNPFDDRAVCENLRIPLPQWFEITYLPPVDRLSGATYDWGPGDSLGVTKRASFPILPNFGFSYLSAENLFAGNSSLWLYAAGPGVSFELLWRSEWRDIYG